MKKLIQDLPPLFELVVVLTIGFGLFLYTSITYIVAGNIEENFSWTSAGFYFIIIYEVISLLIIFYILSVRGWRLQDFYTEFKFRYIWAGIGLMLLGNVIGSIAITIAEKTGVIDNSVINFPIGRIEADWISLLLVIIINSVYEEFLLIGYLFRRLRHIHPAFVIGLSVIIRESFHAYQGWMGLLPIISFGVIFSLYYYKFRNLWPVVIAHGLRNLLIFLNMKYHWYGV